MSTHCLLSQQLDAGVILRITAGCCLERLAHMPDPDLEVTLAQSLQHVLQRTTRDIGGHRLPIPFQLVRRHHVSTARRHQPMRVQVHVIDRAINLMCGTMLGLVRRLVG